MVLERTCVALRRGEPDQDRHRRRACSCRRAVRAAVGCGPRRRYRGRLARYGIRRGCKSSPGRAARWRIGSTLRHARSGHAITQATHSHEAARDNSHVISYAGRPDYYGLHRPAGRDRMGQPRSRPSGRMIASERCSIQAVGGAEGRPDYLTPKSNAHTSNSLSGGGGAMWSTRLRPTGSN
jgi:hypothetical protein